MKIQISIFILVSFFNYAQSQKTTTGIVYYNHIDGHYGESYNSYLVFNQNSSHFVTAKDSLGLSNSSKIETSERDEELLVEITDFNNVRKTRKKGLQVLVDKSIDSIYFTNAFSLTSKTLYAKEKRPEISWKLQSETKKIGDFNCKMATANFRGREYICWYTAEIPLPYGPWKLQGLPGIILEAKSNDGFFEVIFKKIKHPVEHIDVPSNKDRLLKKGVNFLSMKNYILKQKEHIKAVENSLKIQGKKFGVQVDPFSEKDNFLEVFGF